MDLRLTNFLHDDVLDVDLVLVVEILRSELDLEGEASPVSKGES